MTKEELKSNLTELLSALDETEKTSDLKSCLDDVLNKHNSQTIERQSTPDSGITDSDLEANKFAEMLDRDYRELFDACIKRHYEMDGSDFVSLLQNEHEDLYNEVGEDYLSNLSASDIVDSVAQYDIRELAHACIDNL